MAGKKKGRQIDHPISFQRPFGGEDEDPYAHIQAHTILLESSTNNKKDERIVYFIPPIDDTQGPTLESIEPETKEKYQRRINRIISHSTFKPKNESSEASLQEFVFEHIYGLPESTLADRLLGQSLRQNIERGFTLQDETALWKAQALFAHRFKEYHHVQLDLFQKTPELENKEIVAKSLEDLVVFDQQRRHRYPLQTDWLKTEGRSYIYDFLNAYPEIATIKTFSENTLRNLLEINFFLHSTSRFIDDTEAYGDLFFPDHYPQRVVRGQEAEDEQEKRNEQIKAGVEKDLEDLPLRRRKAQREFEDDIKKITVEQEYEEVFEGDYAMSAATFLVMKEFVKDYAAIANDVDDRKAMSVLDSSIATSIATIKGQRGYAERTWIYSGINDLLKSTRNISQELAKTTPLLRASLFSALNYLKDEFPDHRSTSNRYGSDMMTTIRMTVSNRLQEFQAIDPRLHYGILMKTAIAIKPNLNKYSLETSPEFFPGDEAVERIRQGTMKHISKTLDKYLQDARKYAAAFVEQQETGERPVESKEIAKRSLEMKNNPHREDMNRRFRHDESPSRSRSRKRNLLNNIAAHIEKEPDERLSYNALSMYLLSINDERKPSPEQQEYLKIAHKEVERKGAGTLEGLLSAEIAGMLHDQEDKNILLKTVNRWDSKKGPEELTAKLLTQARIRETYADVEDRILANLLLTRITALPNPQRYKQMIRLLDEKADVETFIECSAIQSAHEVCGKLGQGNNATTYKAYSEELKRHRALKVINQDKMSSQEAEIMAKLEGEDLENIVQVYAAGEDIVTVNGRKRYAIDMEYVDGETLQEKAERRKLGEDEVLNYSAQLYNGIKSLRKKGIFHYDLHLNNIKVNSRGTLKILDFGTSSDEQKDFKENRLYRPPSEVARAGDIFSLGLITYTLATGESLVGPREDASISTYKERIAEIKEHMMEGGKLQAQYREKIKANTPSSLQDIIVSCLEGFDDIAGIERSYVRAREELKYHFMDKRQLIQRIKELESGA
jgi:tRNA A-37 threonylcarbamoyl transferase component Bud32